MKKIILLIFAITLVIQIQAENDTLFNKDFNDESLNSGGWTTVLVSGSNNCEWTTSFLSNPTPYGRVTNYSSQEYSPCESWLISPMVDLSLATPFLHFRNAYNYPGENLRLMISSDYSGLGDWNDEIWIDISDLVTWSEGGFEYANSGNIDLSEYTNTNIHIAFKYIGGNTSGSTWNLDDIILFSTQPVDADGWNCTSDGCIESISGSGEYANLNDCQSICSSNEDSIISVYEIQYTEDPTGNSDLNGQVVLTGGIVTAVKSDSSAYFIQNGAGPWSGIYVYDDINFTAIGDSVIFNAEVTEYNNLTELKSVTNFVIASSDNPVFSSQVSPQMADSEEYEGVLVKMMNVQCVESLNQYDEWRVSSDGTVIISGFLYSYSPTINNYYNITGVVDYSFSEFKVCPRNSNDVTVGSTNVLEHQSVSLGLFPNPSYGIIQAKEKGKLEVYSLSGKLIFSKLIDGMFVDLRELSRGAYFCKLLDINGNLKGIDKLVIY